MSTRFAGWSHRIQSRRFVRGMLKRFTSTGVILLYHRVADEGIDPWGLCVRPDHFAEQMEVLHKCYHPISLDEMVKHLRNKSLPSRSVVVTFDDGYVDNLTAAKPILEKFEVPATVFIITGYCDARRAYWWDELETILLRSVALPASLTLVLDGRVREWHLEGAAHYAKGDAERDLHRRVWDAPAGSRLAFFYEVWKDLQPLPAHAQQQALQQIRRWAGLHEALPHHRRPMTVEEIMELEAGGLVQVGAHTMNHPLLPAHSMDVQRSEIRESKRYLEDILAHPIAHFSYPFGAYHNDLVPVVRAEGFASACATIEEAAWRYSDTFELPRFEVQDWDGGLFQKKIDEWFLR